LYLDEFSMRMRGRRSKKRAEAAWPPKASGHRRSGSTSEDFVVEDNERVTQFVVKGLQESRAHD